MPKSKLRKKTKKSNKKKRTSNQGLKTGANARQIRAQKSLERLTKEHNEKNRQSLVESNLESEKVVDETTAAMLASTVSIDKAKK